MDKTIIVLPDGSEIASGDIAQNAVVSCTITRKVNSGNDLTLGSACAAMAEVEFILRSGMIPIAAGDEIRIYRLRGGERSLSGLFTCEKPKVTSDRKLTVTAYDRITWLDKDLTDWLDGLTGWPYSLLNFSQMVCRQCGLAFSSTSFPNSGYLVKKFRASGVTGRDLIRQAAQAAASFCRAAPEGTIEFAWYTPAKTDIGASEYAGEVHTGYDLDTGNVIADSVSMKPEYTPGSLKIQTSLLSGTFSENTLSVTHQNTGKKAPYYLGSLKRQDYQTERIDQVQIQYSSTDVGTKYPEGAGKNVYKITGNFLLTAETAQELIPVAQTVYDRLKTVSYTPLKIVIPTDNDITAGKTVKIISKDGIKMTTYVMSAKDTQAKRTLTSEGSRNRDSVTAVNNRKFEALTGKYLELCSSIDGVNVKIGETNKSVTDVSAKADGISVRVTQVEQTAAENLQDFSDALESEIDGIRNQLDGVIDTWYGEEAPTLNNKPAVDWITESDKQKHSGDLFYVAGTGPDSGSAYRWIYLNGAWYWDKLANSDIAKALAAAAAAQDTADGKRRVFVNTPYTPYDVGDLWSEPDMALMRCRISRESGAFQASDWGYADNSQTQIDEQISVTTNLIAENGVIKASVSEVRDTADAAYEKAASAEVTADAVTVEVKNIQIGGANLLCGSGKMGNYPHNSAGAGSEGTYEYPESGSVIVTNNSSNSYVVIPAPALTHNQNYVFGALFRMLSGEETINFGWQGYQTDGTPTGDSYVYHLHEGNTAGLPPVPFNEMGDGWIRVYFPVMIAHAETARIEILIRGGTFGSYYINKYEIYHPILVDGTKPSAWSPSPKDMEARFEVRADRIESRVSVNETNYTTISQKVTGIETRVTDNETNYSTISQKVTGIETKVTDNETNYSTLSQKVDGIDARVTDNEDGFSEVSQKVDTISNTVKEKVDSSAGTWATFGWELLSDRWELRANDQVVFKVTKDGAYVSGEIRAGSGKIGNWDIGTGLSSNGATWADSSSGMYLGPDGIAFGKSFWVSPDGYLNAGRGKFKGSLEAATGSFSGEVTANSGKIGDWDITTGLSSKGATYQNPGTGIYIGPDGINFGNKFYVNPYGTLYVEGATVKGNIEAENGYFHGTVRAGKIEYGPVSGYVPKAGLDQTARDELGYADFSNQVFNGYSNAMNIGTNVLRVVSNMFFRGGQIGVKRFAGQDVLVVLPKEKSAEEANT